MPITTISILENTSIKKLRITQAKLSAFLKELNHVEKIKPTQKRIERFDQYEALQKSLRLFKYETYQKKDIPLQNILCGANTEESVVIDRIEKQITALKEKITCSKIALDQAYFTEPSDQYFYFLYRLSQHSIPAFIQKILLELFSFCHCPIQKSPMTYLISIFLSVFFVDFWRIMTLSMTTLGVQKIVDLYFAFSINEEHATVYNPLKIPMDPTQQLLMNHLICSAFTHEFSPKLFGFSLIVLIINTLMTNLISQYRTTAPTTLISFLMTLFFTLCFSLYDQKIMNRHLVEARIQEENAMHGEIESYKLHFSPLYGRSFFNTKDSAQLMIVEKTGEISTWDCEINAPVVHCINSNNRVSL